VQEPDERLRLVGGPEVEVDDHVPGVVDRPLDAMPEHTGQLPDLGESVERRLPAIEVDDAVFDVQCRHGGSLARRVLGAASRYARRRTLPIPDFWGFSDGAPPG
jgi:hypothetical protein